MHDERAGAPLPGLRDNQSSGGKVHDSIVRIIGGWVLGGRYLPGDTLPREEDLVESLSVSRTSIREAIKVLAAKGMVESRPRIGVKVRPRDDWRLLDPAVLSWHPNLTRDVELIESLIEVRRIIEPAAAELAAPRLRHGRGRHRERLFRDGKVDSRGSRGVLRGRCRLPSECCRSEPQRHPEKPGRLDRSRIEGDLLPLDEPDGRPGPDAIGA
jgi:DNA-binding transcriptional regulator YhcF (GntR family)